MPVSRSFRGSVVTLYFANGIGALGQLVTIRVISQSTGISDYGVVALYFLSFSVLQVFEASLIRKAVDQLCKGRNGLRITGLFSAWGQLTIIVTLPVAIVLSMILRDFSAGPLVVFVALLSGVLDYVLGLPLVRYSVICSVSGKTGSVAILAAVQNTSRYLVLLLLALSDQAGTWLLILVPLRRLLDWLAMITLGGGLNWRISASFKGIARVRQALWRHGTVSIALMAGTEGLGLAIAIVYGQDAYAKYKAVFDLCSKLWFVTSIFPLVLYPQIKGLAIDIAGSKKIISVLTWSYFAYLGLIVIGTVIAPTALGIIFPAVDISGFVFAAVLFGVALFGHSRLGMEILQAHSSVRNVVMLAIGFTTVMLSVFVAFSFVSYSAAVVGAWIMASIVLVISVDCLVLKLFGVRGRSITLMMTKHILLALSTLAVVWWYSVNHSLFW
jgi:hypothetical protein